MPKSKTEGTPLDMETLAEAFKALSNKNRLSIFEQIRAGCGKAQLDRRQQACRMCGCERCLYCPVHHLSPYQGTQTCPPGPLREAGPINPLNSQ